MEILEQDSSKIKVKFDSTINQSLSSAIRRTLISDIETYAIDEVTVYSNTTFNIFSDSFICKRLGLIPITCNGPSDVIDDLLIELNVKYDSTKTINDVHYIYTDSLIYDKNRIFINDNILITCLFKNTDIHLKASICKGTGYKHRKWNHVRSPTCIEGPDKTYILSYEMISCKNAGDVLKEAILIIRSNVSNLSELVISTTNGIHEIRYKDLGHTYGHLLQSYFLKDKNITYASYNCPNINSKDLMIFKYSQKILTTNSIKKCKEDILKDIDIILKSL